MKRFKMPSQRELRAMYPPQNAEFDEAIRTTIRMLPRNGEREETQVKKKLSMGLVMAILMILALTCAAVAVGMGVFGKMAEQTKDKGYAQLYQTLDEKSVEVGEVQTAEKMTTGRRSHSNWRKRMWMETACSFLMKHRACNRVLITAGRRRRKNGKRCNSATRFWMPIQVMKSLMNSCRRGRRKGQMQMRSSSVT